MTIPPEKLTFLAIRLFKSRAEVVHGIRYYLLDCGCVRYQKIFNNGKLHNSQFLIYRDPLDGACNSCGSSQEKKEQFYSKIIDSGVLLRGDIDKETIIQVNERYQKTITSIISLSTGFLAFTFIFLQDVLQIEDKTKLFQNMKATLAFSWLLLGCTIGFCLLYFYCSARFIKTVAGLEESQWWCENSEKSCDCSFRFALISFALAIAFFIIYAI
jgi:hypothetical protein